MDNAPMQTFSAKCSYRLRLDSTQSPIYKEIGLATVPPCLSTNFSILAYTPKEMLFKTIALLAILANTAVAAPPNGAAFDNVFMIFLENTVRKPIIPPIASWHVNLN